MFQRHDRFEELKGIQDKHNFHIGKLETIMRMVDNDALPLDQVSEHMSHFTRKLVFGVFD